MVWQYLRYHQSMKRISYIFPNLTNTGKVVALLNPSNLHQAFRVVQYCIYVSTCFESFYTTANIMVWSCCRRRRSKTYYDHIWFSTHLFCVKNLTCVKYLTTAKIQSCFKLACCVQTCPDCQWFYKCSLMKLHPAKYFFLNLYICRYPIFVLILQ